jgi:hypothetical protein
VIALAIAVVVCVCVCLVAWWMRDVALRWMHEGQASEESAKLSARVDTEVMPLVKGHGDAIDGLAVRIEQIEATAQQAESTAKQAMTRSTLEVRRR